MTSEQYRLLKAFPIDKSYLSHEQLEKILGGNSDYNALTEAYDTLFNPGFIEGRIPNPGLRITDKGMKTVTDYEMKNQRNEEIAGLEIEKLRLEVENLRNDFFDYPDTKSRAKWAIRLSAMALIVTLILSLLQLICNRPG